MDFLQALLGESHAESAMFWVQAEAVFALEVLRPWLRHSRSVACGSQIESA